MLIIMYEFMIDIDLPIPFTDEFLALVPRQRAVINKLMNEGIISSFALSVESGKLWISVIAESESNVKLLIDSFPIAENIFYQISRLNFFNSVKFKIPEFSLN